MRPFGPRLPDSAHQGYYMPVVLTFTEATTLPVTNTSSQNPEITPLVEGIIDGLVMQSRRVNNQQTLAAILGARIHFGGHPPGLARGRQGRIEDLVDKTLAIPTLAA